MKMMMNNHTYDVLKWIAQYLLPALATLIAVVFGIWNIPHGDQIAATLMAIDTALGVCLGISTSNYKKLQV